MRIELNYEVCESNGVCEAAAPAVFHLDDDDNLHVLQGAVTPDNENDVREAVRRCPRHAITVGDEQ